MKQAFPLFLGNDALRLRLQSEILSSSLSHAYLLEGADGFGKSTLALQIAAALSCVNKDKDGLPLPCGVCPSCRKVLEGKSPDVFHITKEDKAALGVEAVRNLHSDVLIPPNESPFKIYIVEDAHLMTVQAQNAFLLTLEEPPAYVVFLLLCESASLLLETVRSRAPTLRLSPISGEQIEAYLLAHVPEAQRMKQTAPAELEEVIFAAEGSIGKAVDLLDPKRKKAILEQRETARNFVSLCLRPSASQTLQFLGGLSQKREDLIAQWNVILPCLRDLLLCKMTDGAPLCFFPVREEAQRLAYRFSAPKLLQLIGCAEEVIDRFRRNANVRLTLTWFAMQCGLLKSK